jgi:uncharacterized protein YggE
MNLKIKLTIVLSFILSSTFAQVAGNANIQHRVHLPTTHINIPYPNSDEYLITIKGLSNVKADNYVAIFSVKQSAETAAEVNTLIDKRISAVKEYCDSNKNIEFHLDMISFLPVYELDLVKKVFNKKTYNEIPVGFEVKKNIHIKYKDPNFLNDLIEVCSRSEIYDLVRVDYFSDSIEAKKEELIMHAKKLIAKKLKVKEEILEVDFKEYKKQMSDGFTVAYPIEMYTQYKTASSSKLFSNNNVKVNQADISTTYYYKPYFDKDFDFTINPTIFEPVIQIMYEIKVKYTPKPKEDKEKPTAKPAPITKTETIVKKEIIIITQSGEMKTVKLEN